MSTVSANIDTLESCIETTKKREPSSPRLPKLNAASTNFSTMYLLSLHVISRLPVVSAQAVSSTGSSLLQSSRVLQSCRFCNGERREPSPSLRPHIRTLMHCSAARTMAPLLIGRMNSLQSHEQNSFSQQFINRHHVLDPHRSKGPLLTSMRSVGYTVTSKQLESIYIPTPTEKCYELMEYIRDSAGLPWWLTILATTILFRGVVVFPFTVWQQLILARIENAQPIINTYVEQLKQRLAIVAKEKGWSQRQMARVFGQEVRNLVSTVHFEKGCSSHKLAYLPFWQAGIWVSTTIAIGQMTGKHPELFSTELDIDVLPALASEGVLWFSDLMQTDLGLAVLLGLVNVTLVELWSLRRGPLTRTQHYLQNVFRIAAICSAPAAAVMPAAVSFYWLTSSLCGLGQLGLLRWPRARRLLGIPATPSEMKHPMQEMKAELKARYAKKTF